MADKEIKVTGSIQVDLQIQVKRPRDTVWTSLIDETTAWWPVEYYATTNPLRMVFEPIPGGRLYEEAENGAGLLWYTVIAIEPPTSITLAGHIAPPFGGPATSLLRVDLESTTDSTTLLRVSDSVFGCVDADTEQRIAEGWRTLFGNAKTYIEAN